MEDFDLIGCPLAGTNLIEAAAGTGKTYAIAGLYVRLVVEKGLSPGQILVMTYTVAATEELKERIRGNLRDAVAAFSGGTMEDPLLGSLVSRYAGKTERETVRSRLEDALRNFDEAAVYTIHGFCQRTLQEYAFESGSYFDAQMITDQEEIKREIIRDFWRVHLYDAPPEIGGYVLMQKLNPDSLYELVRDQALNDDVRIVPDVAGPPLQDVKALLAAIASEFDRLRAAWPEARETVGRLLRDPGLKANIYGGRVDRFVAAMDDYTASEGGSHLPPEELERFTPQKLAGSVKKGCSPPVHDIFPLCQSLLAKTDDLKRLLDQYVLFLKAELLRTVRRELSARKREKNILFYDDLLSRLRSALAQRGGDSLAEAIRQKYRAAMVDEFQDTDPTQYAIIHAVFGGTDSILFLIGDPKQAIYSFRGADLFAYIQAAAHVDTRYGMKKNWRTDPGLIRAVNALFSHRENPFLYEEIGFHPAEAGEVPGRACCRIGPDGSPSLLLWFLSAGPGQPMSKREARQRVSRAVAGEIARLLDLARKGAAAIGGQPLRAGDIAVLVRKNREAASIQASLRALGIPCVSSSADYVFDSPEAEELERVLAAVTQPGNERVVRTAMATCVMGSDGSEIDRLMADESAWGRHLDRFRTYHDLWRRKGFMRMFRQWLNDEGVRSRLLALEDGERRLTDVLHLSELLHRASLEGGLGMTGLLKWLSAQRRHEKSRQEEHQLRLESDENAVKIVTIHKSKGLEYPVVFCPFAWGGAEVKKIPFTFHDEGNDRQSVCDLGSESVADHKRYAIRESLAENVRLLYVALTRAKHRCYLVWGRFNQAGVSAPAYLFHPRLTASANGVLLAMAEGYKSLTDDEMIGELTSMADRSDGRLAVVAMPEEPGPLYSGDAVEEEKPDYRPFRGRIDRSWRVTSFSYLVSGHPRSAELPDRDTLPEEGDPGPAAETGGFSGQRVTADILDFPKGTRTGLLLHALLEELDFPEPDHESIRRAVRDGLREHGFDPGWEEAVFRMFRNITDCPLESPFGSLKLSSIGKADRLNEMGFYFPLRPISSQGLSQLFARYGSGKVPGDAVREDMGRLHFGMTNGYMRGFMDMVFRCGGRYFLVDWKSNFLGDHIGAYGREALFRAMSGSYYLLQYHLYAVALDRYLAARLPDYDYDAHFGGVYYLFLRGIDPACGPAYGVYYDLPGRGNIEALSSHLIADTGWTKP